MMARAKLFPIEDIIAVITGIPIDRYRRRKVDELVHYVTGHLTMPKKGSSARQDVVVAIRPQLPSGLDQFGIIDLIDLIMGIKKEQEEDQLRATLIKSLRQRYGRQLPLCPEQDLEKSSESLVLLRSLAESPDAALTPD